MTFHLAQCSYHHSFTFYGNQITQHVLKFKCIFDDISKMHVRHYFMYHVNRSLHQYRASLVYIKIARNKSLEITIAWTAVTSFVWAPLDTLLRAKHDMVKLAKVCIAMSAYTGKALTVECCLNVALLKTVRQKTKNLSIQKSFHSKFLETIAVIVSIMVISYTPLMIALNIAA